MPLPLPPPPSHRQTRPSGDVDGTEPPPPLPFFKLVPNFLVGIVWAAIYLGRWFETRFLHPVADFFLDVALTSAEEGAKSLLREAFAALSRGVDGATAAILALLVDRRYWRARRSLAGSRRRAAWADYWREGRPSTLNAVVARTGVSSSNNNEVVASASPFAQAAAAANAATATAAASEVEREEDARRSPSLSPDRDPSLSPSTSASASPSQMKTSPGPAPPLRGPRPRGWAGKAASRAAHAAAGALVAARSAVAGDGAAAAEAEAASALAAAAAAAGAGAGAAASRGAPRMRGSIPIDADAATARRAAADAAAHASAAENSSINININNNTSSSPFLPRAPSSSLRRNGSDLFDRANWSTDVARSRGLLEDTRLALEEALSAAADGLRAGVRWLLLMPGPPQPIDSAGNSGSFAVGGGGVGGSGGGGASLHSLHFHNVAVPPTSSTSSSAAPPPPPTSSSSTSASLLATHPGTTGPPTTTRWEELARDRPRGARILRRSNSASTASELLSEVRTAGDVVVAAGYPLEEHTVTTSDGYVLTMQRIPRPGSRDVALFVHGIMDTSMGWVGNGVTGSHAFAAFDAGSDVWLCNSRANPPCAHVDCPRMDPRGLRYWRYTVNEMAMEDVAAQVDHVHVVKTQELRPAAWWRGGGGGGGGGGENGNLDGENGGDDPNVELHRRAASEQPAASPPPPSSSTSGGNLLPPASVLERGFARVAAADAAATLATAVGRVRPSASDSDLVSSPMRHLGAGGAKNEGADNDNNNGNDGASEITGAEEQPSTPRLASVAVLAAAEAAAAAAPPNEATLRAAVVAGGAEGVLAARSILRSQASSSQASSQQREGVTWRRNAPGSAPPTRGGGAAPSLQKATTTVKTTTTATTPPSPLPRARPLAASAASTPSRPNESTSVAAAAAAAAASAAAQAAARAAALASEDGLRRRRHRGEMSAGEGGASGGEGAFLSAAAAARVASAAADARSPSTSPSGGASGAGASSSSSTEPYRLTAVGHSMGGAALLIYAVMCRVVRRPHHLARLVLLSPAGFQSKPPLLSRPFIRMVPLWTAFLDKVVGRFFVPGAGLRFLLPTSPLRFVAFKLTHDLRHLPAAEELARAFARACMSGDTSEWDRALRLPHYSAKDMPSVSEEKRERARVCVLFFLPKRKKNPSLAHSFLKKKI